MAGLSMRLSLQVSDPRAVRKLRGMNDGAKKRLNIQLANAMRNSTLDRFSRGEDPEGRPWAPIGGTARADAKADSLERRAKGMRLGRKRQSEAARAKRLLRQASQLAGRVGELQMKAGAGDRFSRVRLGRRIADMQRRAEQLQGRAGALASGRATVRKDLSKQRATLYRRARAARKYARDHVPLNDTGRLRSSITVRASASEAVVGTNTVYGRIHHYGGETGRRGARVVMPARPFFGFNAEDRRISLGIVRVAIKETVLP